MSGDAADGDRADAVAISAALLGLLSHAADPDAALAGLHAVVESLPGLVPDIADAMRRTDIGADALVRVLGASDAMATLMRTRPRLVRACLETSADTTLPDRTSARAAMLGAVGADPESTAPVAGEPLTDGTRHLRERYHELLAGIMARDLLSADPEAAQPEMSLALSDLADAALESALAIARREVPGSAGCRFAIIGMGKLGARELNYVSDVDLIYVVEPAGSEDAPGLSRVGTRMSLILQRICQSVMPGVAEPALWQIDGGLRPEGKDGPLVRRLDSHLEYYARWAESWEFQALLKARAAAGDPDLGADYVRRTRPLVWSASSRENFVNDCQAMRRRVEDLIPRALQDREVKLGRGGLRDVEFTVQMLQLVHGRTDESLRVPGTLGALKALSDGGYVSRRQAARLAGDYRFERVIEHRQQMWMLQRTHLFPDLGGANRGGLDRKRDATVEELGRNRELRRLARAFGLLPERLLERYDDARREVRRLHMEIYYRPMLPISAQAGEDAFSLDADAARVRLASVGFGDPDAAMRHMRALTAGVSRAARINRILLPAVLQWLGEGQNPDMGLLVWRRLEELFGTDSDYLGFLRDSPSAARRLCHILADSRFLGQALTKSIESVTWLGDDALLRPRTRKSLDVQCRAMLDRSVDSLADFATSLRAMRRQEIERIGLSWLSGVMDDDDCLEALTDVTDAIVDAALAWAREDCVRLAMGRAAEVSVIGMGRYGGRELNFSSDVDAILIYRPTPGHGDAEANSFARAVVDRLRSILQGAVSLEPRIDLDLDLRPEGRDGPLVRSLDSCAEYYASWASTWEHQALIRARHAAGDPELSGEFLERVADPLRFPTTPLDDEQIGQIRRLKARMEGERLPRGVRRDRHLKLGRGGLSDVEWTVQLLQLLHAGDMPSLRTGSTMQALDALVDAGIVSGGDREVLRAAWRTCTAARNASYLWTGRIQQADVLPDDRYSLAGIAVCLGYPPHHGQTFDNDLMSRMRRSREVVMRLFYGEDS